jgi:hypothetical protein
MFCNNVPCTCFDKPKAEPKPRKRAAPKVAAPTPATPTRPTKAPPTAPEPVARTSALVDAMRAAATVKSDVTITRPRTEEELVIEDVEMCMALQACESIMSEDDKRLHAKALALDITPEQKLAVRQKSWKERLQ